VCLEMSSAGLSSPQNGITPPNCASVIGQSLPPLQFKYAACGAGGREETSLVSAMRDRLHPRRGAREEGRHIVLFHPTASRA